MTHFPQSNSDTSLSVVAIDEKGNLVFGHPTSTVRGPQTFDDQAWVVKGVDADGNIIGGPVFEEDIDSGTLTGYRAISSTSFEIAPVNVQYVVFDNDDDRLRPGSILLGRVPNEDCWAWGL